MTDSSYLLDSSLWLGYFKEGSRTATQIIEGDNILLTSVISIYEIAKKLTKHGASPGEVQKRLDFVNNVSLLTELSPEIAQKAASDSLNHGLHSIDALIYRSALENGATLVTMDRDFEKLPGVRIVKTD